MPVYNGICVYIVPNTGELELYFTVYRCIVYYRGRVHSYDGGYERGNVVLKVA